MGGTSSKPEPTEEEKLNEFKRLQRISRLTDASINQSNSGFSVVSIQWANYAAGGAAILLLLLLGIALIIFCYCRRKGHRREKARHQELLAVFSKAKDTEGSAAICCEGQGDHRWTRAPMGWQKSRYGYPGFQDEAAGAYMAGAIAAAGYAPGGILQRPAITYQQPAIAYSARAPLEYHPASVASRGTWTDRLEDIEERPPRRMARSTSTSRVDFAGGPEEILGTATGAVPKRKIGVYAEQ